MSKLRSKGKQQKSSPLEPRFNSARAHDVSACPVPSLITLLTDFGSSDYFVGAMKGVILSINPAVQLIDITHDIPAQDIEAAAFNLLAVYRSFAPGTINVAVVDPGVGSARRPILVCAREQFFVGPDNGIFSYILDREPDALILQLTNDKYFRKPVSNTFHGRDIFAPVAAALSTGVQPAEFGSVIADPVRLPALAPEKLKGQSLRGRIIHVDRFGNCVTSFTREHLTESMIAKGVALRIKGKVIREFRDFFAAEDRLGSKHLESQIRDHKLFAVWGSAGFLEIAARNQSAAKLLKARRGDSVTFVTGV